MTIRQLIHESNLIEGYDSAVADAQSLLAWLWLIEHPELNNGIICRLQKRIVNHQDDLMPHWRGYYRSLSGKRVWIGGREGLDPDKIPAAMDHWLKSYKVISPKSAHINFEVIHPFVDGNGRTGRMLLWYQQKQAGLPLTEITYENRRQYYRWFI